MFELTLSTVVKDGDLKMACAVLGGLCAMEPWHDLHHVLFFKGPTQPRGIAKTSSIPDYRSRKESATLWKELHQNLVKQSSVVRAKYEVFKDVDFGKPVPDLNAKPGTLVWADFPDPPQNLRLQVTQRKKVEIWEQNNLPTIMSDNNYAYVLTDMLPCVASGLLTRHRFKSEAIEEALHFYRDDVEFCLFRHYPLPPVISDKPKPLGALPPWENMTVIDKEKRWLFVGKYHVVQDTKPDEVKKGCDVLMNIKKELEGVFDFKNYDRRCHDTRIAREISNTPVPLPNRQVL
jgi:mediator of RNA polymerase II transcription subunit 18